MVRIDFFFFFYCGWSTAILGMDLLQGIVVRWELVAGTAFIEIHPNSPEFDSYKQISSLTLCQYIEVERLWMHFLMTGLGKEL